VPEPPSLSNCLLQYICITDHEDAMAASKIATVTLRIEPEIKEALQRAAELEHRSIAKIVEVLIREHCRVKGIATGDTSNNKRAAREATL
jgi:hypothetical protein